MRKRKWNPVFELWFETHIQILWNYLLIPWIKYKNTEGYPALIYRLFVCQMIHFIIRTVPARQKDSNAYKNVCGGSYLLKSTQ